MITGSHITIDKLYSFYLQYPAITTDSRNIVPGAMFFALKGENFDGNRFAGEALEKGAAYTVIDDPACRINDRCILTEDVLQTLQELALHHRKQLSIPVIGITGSNGKTTTKELIHTVLSQRYNTVSTSGNLNNHIGVPLTLLSVRSDTGIAVIEMGANHPGEIDLLCNIVLPTHGLITNIGRAHIEGFGNIEGVVKAKTELYRYLEYNHGTLFVNAGDPLLLNHAQDLQKVTYGFTQEADLSGKITQGRVNLEMELVFPQSGALPLRSHLFGSYNALNILAAASIGDYFNITPEEIVTAIGAYKPSNNRSQVCKTQNNLLILDAYNANPTSMELVLTDFAGTKDENMIVILGDMLELGEDTESEHLKILNLLEELGFSRIFLVGPVFSRLNKNSDRACFKNSMEAKAWFEKSHIQNATILLKGSRGIRLEEIVEFL